LTRLLGPVAALLVLTALFPGPLSAAPAFSEAELHRIEGDYTVTVYPKPFGFLVQEGRLFLKVGGVAGEGRAVPLLSKEDGRFVLSEGHPNAFRHYSSWTLDFDSRTFLFER